MKGRPVSRRTRRGHLGLFHDLQEGRLGLGRGAVDLIGQDDRGEDRALVEVPRPRPLVVNGHTRDVGGQQVGRELDTRMRPVDGGRDGTRQRRLACSRRVLEEQVPLGEHAGQRQADDLFLAQECLADVVRDPREGVGEPVGVVCGDFHCCPLLCCGLSGAVMRALLLAALEPGVVTMRTLDEVFLNGTTPVPFGDAPEVTVSVDLPCHPRGLTGECSFTPDGYIRRPSRQLDSLLVEGAASAWTVDALSWLSLVAAGAAGVAGAVALAHG